MKELKIGDIVFVGKYNLHGRIVELHPDDETVVVRSNYDEKEVVFVSYDECFPLEDVCTPRYFKCHNFDEMYFVKLIHTKDYGMIRGEWVHIEMDNCDVEAGNVDVDLCMDILSGGHGWEEVSERAYQTAQEICLLLKRS